MLDTKLMNDIQYLKLQGYTPAEIHQYLEGKGSGKVPSMPTIRKYFYMDVLPEDPGTKLRKDKVFDHEPFRSTIIETLRRNKKKVYVSSIYDLLQEKFIESGQYNELPGNAQTLRNYVHYLEASHIVEEKPESTRIYDHVEDTPPGEQAIIDYGVMYKGTPREIHFICILLRYSRYLVVFMQDHKYNSTEACTALYRGFCRLGGRPKVLVIDQDSVFITSELYGEIITTRVFNDFLTEQELKLWVCHKGDPESKGGVESAVGFVKKNFFSARDYLITGIQDAWKSLPGWLTRANKRVHKTTYRIPVEVFVEEEKGALRPLIPSLYESSKSSFNSAKVDKQPFMQYLES